MPKLNMKFGRSKRGSAPTPSVKELHLALNHGDNHRIARAVRLAEQQTSCEIMIKLSAVTSAEEPVRDIARGEFSRMGLHQLPQDNGVLVYVSLNRHAVEIVVGSGAADKLPQALWDAAVETIANGFRAGTPADGIIRAVEDMTDPLARAFPPSHPDTIDLPDVSED